ncbi:MULTISPECIES: GntR family transcriptional regulator [Carboxydothermus]|uniref:Transcriptional regulator, GntR family n=2 Tax=Carboxydothermus TaxID=129957 RepID=Q3AFM3_CARHZ|nr:MULTISPECIES: GntR family transcriptional regulator [Carboxydothermus]ABB16185.1 transcriptional regulator, GntR family [Carboxydothermus hydrogenoformans Z-2901]NYE57399.1 DNA-binding GntR family transcriptional regulator [Carboxydothermus ferrireducens DSM 11255]
MGRLKPIILDNYKPLRELVFETLREAIINGVLKPGERLMEVQLAEELGVSRTPVREAIRKLELEGFVVMIPRKGAYVAGISLKDVADVFEVRAALESLAAGLAAERITDEEIEELERVLVQQQSLAESDRLEDIIRADTDFHEVLYRASRNERLIQIVSHLREQIQRFRTASLSQPGRLRLALEEHKEIVEAIAERNVEKAQALAREHIENAEQSMINGLKERGELIGD